MPPCPRYPLGLAVPVPPCPCGAPCGAPACRGAPVACPVFYRARLCGAPVFSARGAPYPAGVVPVPGGRPRGAPVVPVSGRRARAPVMPPCRVCRARGAPCAIDSRRRAVWCRGAPVCPCSSRAPVCRAPVCRGAVWCRAVPPCPVSRARGAPCRAGVPCARVVPPYRVPWCPCAAIGRRAASRVPVSAGVAVTAAGPVVPRAVPISCPCRPDIVPPCPYPRAPVRGSTGALVRASTGARPDSLPAPQRGRLGHPKSTEIFSGIWARQWDYYCMQIPAISAAVAGRPATR